MKIKHQEKATRKGCRRYLRATEENDVNHTQGHSERTMFAPRGAWQSGVSADFFALGYDAFGALLPGRNYSSGSYNYGFQGQIKDDEIHGATGTSYAFEYRMHDPRIGRFLSLDPLSSSYPWNSPYAFAENSVIRYCDLEGLERGDRPSFYGATGLVLAIDTDADAEGRILRQMHANEHMPPPPSIQEQMANRQFGTIGVPDRDRIRNINGANVSGAVGVRQIMTLATGRDYDGEHHYDASRAMAGGELAFMIFGDKIGKYLFRGAVWVMRSGVAQKAEAAALTQLGHAGGAKYNEALRMLRSSKGGNFIAESEEQARRLIGEAYPDIAQEAAHAESSFGFRVEAPGAGATQGHVGPHLNFYDKEAGTWGTMTWAEGTPAAAPTTPP